MTAIGANPSEESIRIGPISIRFLTTGSDSNGSSAVFEMTVPAGVGVAAPPHSHDAYEETIYVTNGSLSWIVDGNVLDVAPGQALCIPRGAVHAFANHDTHNAKALVIITPAAIGPEFFRESADVINSAAGGRPDPAKMAEIMLRHGLTPAPPPNARERNAKKHNS